MHNSTSIYLPTAKQSNPGVPVEALFCNTDEITARAMAAWARGLDTPSVRSQTAFAVSSTRTNLCLYYRIRYHLHRPISYYKVPALRMLLEFSANVLVVTLYTVVALQEHEMMLSAAEIILKFYIMVSHTRLCGLFEQGIGTIPDGAKPKPVCKYGVRFRRKPAGPLAHRENQEYRTSRPRFQATHGFVLRVSFYAGKRL